MRRCPHKCAAPRGPPLSGRRARKLASRCVEDLPALASAGACVRVAVRGAEVRALRGAGARAHAPSAAGAPLFLRSASTAARGRGHRVLGVAWIVGSARIQRRGSPWAAQSWFSNLGIPQPAGAEREPASPSPGAPRSLYSVRGLQPPGGAEGSRSGLGEWDGGRGDAEVIPLSSLPVVSAFPCSILQAPQIPCMNTKVPSIPSSAT